MDHHLVICVGAKGGNYKMDKSHHGKHSKDKIKFKKRKSREENGDTGTASVVKPLVEYSDVSSEDLSEPEAGEIQSGESISLSDDDLRSKMHRNSHHSRYVSGYYFPKVLVHSPSRRHRLDPAMIPRSPSPLIQRRERKLSVSSRSSISSDVRHRRKYDSPTPQEIVRQVITSPAYDYDLDKKKRKGKKRHKKDKKYKKKKKRSKHRSRSTSLSSNKSNSPATRVSDKVSIIDEQKEALSDWEEPVEIPPEHKHAIMNVVTIDADACSPVSNDSHIASPDPIDDKIQSPIIIQNRTPPTHRKHTTESPHTPPIKHSSRYNHVSPNIIIDLRDRDYSKSPILVDGTSRDHSLSRHSFSPIRTSPYRNPSPDVVTSYSHSRASISPPRKRRNRDSGHHHRHRREKEREKRHTSRSRSPRRKVSRSPSYNRRHHSRSPRVRSKKYKSRSPKNIRERSRTPVKKEKANRSPSPSFKSSLLKNKITDTSLFAELVKDKHKREMELKKLLEKKENVMEKDAPSEVIDQTVNSTVKTDLVDIFISMDIDNIPIPSEDKVDSAPSVQLNEIALPEVKMDIVESKPPTPQESVMLLPIIVKPPPVPAPVAPPLPKPPKPLTPKKSIPLLELSKSSKLKNVTKLPMPPGINQTDLETIESPPSRSPSPMPLPKAKTPPRKSIMNLPLPLGKIIIIIITVIMNV